MLQKLKEKRETLEAYRKVFLSHEGSIVLRDFMKSAYMYQTVADPDPYVTAFNEGQRAFVIRLLQQLKMSPHQIEELIQREFLEKE